jgi:hypothetical protein
MFLGFDPSIYKWYKSVGVQTESLINTPSSQEVNSVASESYFPDLVDVNSVDSDSYFPDLEDVDTGVGSDSHSLDLVDSDTSLEVNSVDSESYFPDLVGSASASKEFYDIEDSDVISNYLEDSSNSIIEMTSCGEPRFFLTTNTEILSVDTMVYILKELLAIIQ